MTLYQIPSKTLAIMGVLLLGVFVFSRCGSDALADLPDTVDFNYHVRPILVQKCYLCHGPDESSRKASLRLDTYEGATALLKNGGRAIDPGHAAGSLLVERIFHKDPAMVMPTPESNMTLTTREMALLEKWIEQGAEYQPHWAFLPPKESNAINGYRGNPIDYFINDAMDQAGLRPSPKASNEALLRRVAFLLTGLPPTEKERSLLLADSNKDAYAKMVDYYLQSPHFGERWARHWMDIARYAETRGHEFDYPIQDAWRYRDYLIRAFNEDLPYDQFLKEHLAGDLLPLPRIDKNSQNESMLGTAFLTMAEGTHSPVDIRKDEADRIDNMIDVTGKAFLGLTISCARCHDHKFDPISTKEYYSFYGIMEGTRFSPQPVNQNSRKNTIDQLIKVQDSIRHWTDRQLQTILNFTAEVQSKQVRFTQADSGKLKMLGDFSRSDLDGWYADGWAFGTATTLGDPIFTEKDQWVGVKEGVASSRKIATGVYGALRSPDFTLNTDFLCVEAAGLEAGIRIVIDNFQLIRYPIYGEMEQAVQSSRFKQYVFNVSQWKGHKAYIEVLSGKYVNHVFVQSPTAYVDVRYAIAFDKKEQAFQQNRQNIQSINQQLTRQRLPVADNELAQLLKEERRLQALLADTLRFFSGVTDGVGRNSKVFVRGSHTELSVEPVQRQFLTAVSGRATSLDVKGSGRLELADALTAANNPLTARVMVNRIWHHLFGKGIVETVDNFGLQGKLPSHPELLDYLAIEFARKNYSIKNMIRQILLSDAFQRSVKPGAEAKKQDPTNLWLSHFPLRRLEAEAIRDALLAVSGSLDSSMYGAPVAQHITGFMNGRGKPSQSGPMDGDGRRSIYQEVRRNFLDPMMTSFDRPIPFTSFGKREVTNVPSQSLILLNDPFVIQQAERMSVQLKKLSLPTTEAKISWVYRACFNREPSVDELKDGTELINRWAVKNESTAWKDYIHSIFNLKEFIYLN